MESPNQNEQVDMNDVVVEYIELDDVDFVPAPEQKPIDTVQLTASEEAADPTEPMEKEEFEYQSAEMAGIDKKRNIVREVFVYLMIVATAFLLAVFFTRMVIINTHIPSNSMENTIQTNDRLIGLRLAYMFTEPQRGDIIIFQYPDDPTQTFIKRVIGVPGDVVEIINGELFINNHKVTEEYIKEPMVGNFGPYEVPEGGYFVMGDNRNISDDARYWNNKYVSKDAIIARAWFRYSPNFTDLWNQ